MLNIGTGWHCWLSCSATCCKQVGWAGTAVSTVSWPTASQAPTHLAVDTIKVHIASVARHTARDTVRGTASDIVIVSDSHNLYCSSLQHKGQMNTTVRNYTVSCACHPAKSQQPPKGGHIQCPWGTDVRVDCEHSGSGPELLQAVVCCRVLPVCCCAAVSSPGWWWAPTRTVPCSTSGSPSGCGALLWGSQNIASLSCSPLSLCRCSHLQSV